MPWAVELKHHVGGAGQYYRHAVGQAVLYREFIRRADLLEPWFEKRGMDRGSCEALVALTPGKGKDWSKG